MNKNIRYLIISERYSELSKYIEFGIIKMEEAIKELIHLNDALYIYKFARYIKNASIDKLADAIITTQNAEYIYNFAHYVKNAPINKLAHVLIDMQSTEYIANFILDDSNISVETFKNLVETFLTISNAKNLWIFILRCKSNQYIKDKLNEVFYPRNIIKELFQNLVARKDIFYIKELLKIASMEEVKQYVLETNDADFIAKFKDFITFGITNKLSVFSLSEENIFKILRRLYIQEDFKTIRQYREVFNSLFQDEEEVKRKL